ncbi:MAG: exodeoxyribonuclease VII large subunit [Gammaproteobacteria bacterium]|nr:exodeoxyribonuclease VII large subunit [Gammaproteobacteria bacterium]
MNNQSVEEIYKKDIYSVSRLNREVRSILEGGFPLLWVEGEISNLAKPSSGHIYFTLKDASTQVRCAMFRMKRKYLRFQPENGLQVILRVRVSLYEARGEFQLIAEHMEPSGEGALRQAFEQLKQQLSAEGLFDSELKRPLPAFPSRIGIITSPTGAALQDVLTVLKRRFPALTIVVFPVPVQGKEAPGAVVKMIDSANRDGSCDLLILTRGGGSLEDLQAFNDELVARAIYGSKLPIVSAIGHEIDFTIADFVADHRAPTPSAAAEMVSPDQVELNHKLDTLFRRLVAQARQAHNRISQRVGVIEGRLNQSHPGNRLIQRQQQLDELERRLSRNLQVQSLRLEDRLNHSISRLLSGTPARKMSWMAESHRLLDRRLFQAIDTLLDRSRQRFGSVTANLQSLSPLATLSRGYSVTRRLKNKEVVLDPGKLAPGEEVETLLAGGSLIAQVIEIHPKQIGRGAKTIR